jgi:two-component system chemotaxis sensor kinase CheA
MGADQFVETFREEAYELLGSLEASLLELEAAPQDKDLLSAVFRVMHTIKGSAAMFGLDRISSFAHEVESVLSALRDGKLPFSPSIIDYTLRSRDIILNMLADMSSSGGGPLSDDLVAFLSDFKADVGWGADSTEQKDGGGAAATADAGNETVGGIPSTYHVTFKPGKEIFKRGVNPLSLIQEIERLGESVCIPNFDDVASLSSLNPEENSTCWEIYVTTAVPPEAIRDVFIFVEDVSEIRVERLEDVVDETGGKGKRLGEILVERGKLEPGKLDGLLKSQKRIGEILLEEKIVSPTDVMSALEEQKQLQRVNKAKVAAVDVSTVRVKSEKLDALMALAGELVTIHARILQTSRQARNDELLSIVEQFGRLTDELRSNTMSIRMVPIGTTFTTFRRLVRDLSAELGKSVELVAEGGETELDKTVIEKLNDPLIHIIRNSLDHGIEDPETRSARGKPPVGTIRLSASQAGASVHITIEDDGNGLNKAAIRAKAIAKGLVRADEALSDDEIHRLIFAPGFSTKEAVTAVSGRGVGMDVVNRQMELINGTVAIESREGEFTRIVLKIPLTLAIIEGLLVRIADEFFVVPLSVVEGCLEFAGTERRSANGIVVYHGDQLPYVNMREFFGIAGDRPAIEQVVVVSIKGQRVGLLLDQVIGGNQTVIKPLGKLYKRAEGVSSATILGDGSVALILDVERIVDLSEREEACV